MRSGKLLAAACAALFVGAVSAQDVGKAAPAFDLPAAGVPNVRLADLKGRVVYVDFWASWCAPCKQSFPWMNDMQAKYGPQGLTIIGVNVDKKREDADKFLSGTPAKFTVAYDTTGKVAEAYQPKGMPTSFLIDASGVVRAVHIGFRDKDKDELERELAGALAAAGKK
ncbi:MAG TPA: TlpA disulfide reductase family protein [Burkholderiaceae bacterium]|nr:TlpA disulfide reductase family protein [Burkholderiaceae bacterium]HQR69408.1 TlpA disulfide reductase family protein [Burkholderiaceae bacterium]